MKRLASNAQGGAAVTEFAIATVAIVPLILYANWFADVAHYKLKLEEATVVSTMDMTRFRVNDFSRRNPNFGALYGHATSAAATGPGSIHQLMAHSFDSADPSASTFASAVFARPSRLKVQCDDHLRGGAPGAAANYAMNESRPGEHVGELNTDAWVTCRADATVGTIGVPAHFQEMASQSNLMRASWALLPLCGIGPGVSGCGGGRDTGLSIMLDDWGLWDTKQHQDADLPLSLSDWPHDPTSNETVHSANGGVNDQNVDYFKMAKRFWRSPQENQSVPVMADAMSVAGVKELGKTDWFHMSYRYTGDHSYGDSEVRDGQRGAFGGPDGITRVTPHTGGPWHEHYGVPSGGTPSGGVSRETFLQRAPAHYMGVPQWTKDGQ